MLFFVQVGNKVLKPFIKAADNLVKFVVYIVY